MARDSGRNKLRIDMRIKLLDNTEHDIVELLDNMYSDDFYYNYLGKVALSSSNLKLLEDGVKTYYYVMKYGREGSQALRDGNLFHTMILEPEKLNHYVFLNVESKNTKAYKEACEYHTDVYTQKEKRDAERLVDAVFRNQQAMNLLRDAEYEVPMIGSIKGTPFRGKADILKNNGIMVDLKTTIDVKNFHISARKYGYHRQCYIYCSLFNVDPKDFVFLVIDKKNLDIGIFECSEEFYQIGKEETETLIDLYWDTIGNPSFEIDEYVLRGTL
jgi:hypothetical protein